MKTEAATPAQPAPGNPRSLALNVPRTILLLLLPGLYLADVIYGTLSYLGLDAGISPGTLIRGAALLGCLAFLLRHRREMHVVAALYLALLVALIVPGIVHSIAASPAPATLAYELRAAARALFGPVLVVFLCFAIRRWRIPARLLLSYLEITFYLLGGALFCMQSLDIGLATYGAYASGSKGIFGPQNDVSLALGLSMVAAIYRLLVHPSFTRLVLVTLAVFGCVGLGTRTSLLLTAAVPAAVVLVVLTSSGRFVHPRIRRRLVRYLGPLLCVIFAAAVVITVHEISQYEYQIRKYSVLLEGDHPRAPLMAAGYDHLAGRGAVATLVGEGAASFHGGVYQQWEGQSRTARRMVEVDWLDLYGQYGLLFAALLHVPPLLLILLAAARWILVRHPLDGLGVTALSIYLAHSALAGHALTTPIPSSLAATWAAMLIMLPRLPDAGARRQAGHGAR